MAIYFSLKIYYHMQGNGEPLFRLILEFFLEIYKGRAVVVSHIKRTCVAQIRDICLKEIRKILINYGF